MKEAVYRNHLPTITPRIIKKQKRIAYFSMEIGINNDIPTYSGGLGILAGDTIRSCADLRVPLVAVTLLYKKGYFYQQLEEDGTQKELPYQWDPREHLELLRHRVGVIIEGRQVYIRAWLYRVVGVSGYCVPVIFLDTDFAFNSEYDRTLTHYLYGGDRKYRLAQEIILGVGGVRMLNALGYTQIIRYHRNEGHASLLVLELLRENNKRDLDSWDVEKIRPSCVFTTHTPVPAGHDKFDYQLVQSVLGDFVPLDLLKQLAGESELNMTLLALNCSHYVNGVAKRHGQISQEMFPGYHIDSITNGVHPQTWVFTSFQELYDRYIPGWRNDPFSLRYALNLPREEIWDAHLKAKERLISIIVEKTGLQLEKDSFTIGFARRATAYKRANLIFLNKERLRHIINNKGKIQIIFAGKAHPNDWQGKELIKMIFKAAEELKDDLKVVYLANYDINLAKLLVAGVDLWLNTPRPPQEASGTSGMKASLNGVPSLSILDGWWIEGCLEGITGWGIGNPYVTESDDNADANALYDKLENTILPLFYQNHEGWIDIMRHAIAMNGSFFNTHRMVQQYVLNAYLT